MLSIPTCKTKMVNMILYLLLTYFPINYQTKPSWTQTHTTVASCDLKNCDLKILTSFSRKFDSPRSLAPNRQRTDRTDNRLRTACVCFCVQLSLTELTGDSTSFFYFSPVSPFFSFPSLSVYSRFTRPRDTRESFAKVSLELKHFPQS